MYLMPQLPTPFADALARQFCLLSVEDCRKRRTLESPNRVFTATGGTRIPDRVYTKFCGDLVAIADRSGYPNDNKSTRTTFDTEAAILLHREFRISENEAAKPGVWNFLTCVVAPDLVRWRFQTSDATPLDRFLAGQKHLLQRLWWRAKAYYDPANAADPYWLVREIGEDESVGMMERTTLSGIRPLVIAILRTLIETHRTSPGSARSELMRDAMKRFLRLGAVVAFESLNGDELRHLCRQVLNESVVALGSAKPKAGAKDSAAKRVVRPDKRQDDTTVGSLAALEASLKSNQLRRRG